MWLGWLAGGMGRGWCIEKWVELFTADCLAVVMAGSSGHCVGVKWGG